MKNNYLHRIDEIINNIENEYTSKHEPFTKVLNNEYYCGQLQALFELIQETEETKDFVACYEYRKEDRDRLQKLFNDKYITPLYNKIRAVI